LQDLNKKISRIELLVVNLKALFAAKISLILIDIFLIYSLEASPAVLIVWHLIFS
jgi:hypothetical protein